MSPDDMGELGRTILRALLKRRCIQYLAKKVSAPACAEGCKMAYGHFATFQRFRESGLGSAELGRSESGWARELPPWVVDTAVFFNKLLRGSPKLDDVMDEQLRRDSMISAEVFLHSSAFQSLDVYDLKGTLESRSEYELSFTTPTKRAAPVDLEEATPAPELTVASEDAAETEEPMPEQEEKVGINKTTGVRWPSNGQVQEEVPASVNHAGYFQTLALPDHILEVLRKCPDEKFEDIVEETRLRIDAFVQLEIVPMECWRDRLVHLPVENGTARWFIYDAKVQAKQLPKDICGLPFKRAPACSARELKLFLHGLSLVRCGRKLPRTEVR